MRVWMYAARLRLVISNALLVMRYLGANVRIATTARGSVRDGIS